jgi:hypothetical protein
MKNYRDPKLFDDDEQDLDAYMEEILRRRELEAEAEEETPLVPGNLVKEDIE